MKEEILKYIVNGITIDRCNNGYSVFTIPTQRFYISSLDELTPERFELAIKSLKERDDLEMELLREFNEMFYKDNNIKLINL